MMIMYYIEFLRRGVVLGLGLGLSRPRLRGSLCRFEDTTVTGTEIPNHNACKQNAKMRNKNKQISMKQTRTIK